MKISRFNPCFVIVGPQEIYFEYKMFPFDMCLYKLFVLIFYRNDDMVFRKTPSAGSDRYKLRRSTAEARSKLRSPMKKRESQLKSPMKKRGLHLRSPMKKQGLHLRSPKKKQESHVHNPKEENEVSKDCVKDDLTINDSSEDFASEDDHNVTTDNFEAPGSCSANNVKGMLPPLLGPMTEFSKRQYKKIHGISPEKVFLPKIKSDETPPQKDQFSPQKLEKEKGRNVDHLNQTDPGKSIGSQTEAKNAAENKSGNVALKLKEQVKEFIKLGSSLSEKTSSVPRSSPESKNVLPEKRAVEEFPQQAQQSSPSNLVIQCDLRVNNTELINSPNSVSVQETIGNLIKQHRSKLQMSNSKQARPQQNEQIQSNSQNDIVNSHLKVSDIELLKGNENKSTQPNNTRQLLHNLNNLNLLRSITKKTVTRPTISPVTFGKLVPPEDQSRNINKSKDKTESIPSKNKNDKPSERRKKVFTTLFGDSPSKSCSSDAKVHASELNKGGVDKSSSPSSTYSPLRTDSPIFPSSPSLDSDDDDSNDLVIDTTAGSQNQSPQVSGLKCKEIANKSNISVSEISSRMVDILKKQKVKSVSHCQNDGLHFLGNNLSKHSLHEISYNKNNQSKEENIKKSDDKCFVGRDKENRDYQVESKGIGLPDLAQCFSLDTPDLPLKNTSKVIEKDTPIKSPTENISKECDQSNEAINGFNANSNHEQTSIVPIQLSSEHSENSVLNMAEDTVGFVSALTRIRDISPIRTPDKKSKALEKTQNDMKELANINEENKVLSESQTSNENLVAKSCEISVTNQSATPPPQETQVPINSAKNENDTLNETNTIQMEEKVMEKYNTLKEPEFPNPHDNPAIVKIDNTQTSVEHNVFRRKRPVRLLKIQSSNASVTLPSSEKENINIRTLANDANLPDNTTIENSKQDERKIQVVIINKEIQFSTQPNNKETIAVLKTNHLVENKLDGNIKSKSDSPLKELEEQQNSILKENNSVLSCDEGAAVSKTESNDLVKPQLTKPAPCKNIIISPDIVKSTFKRSNTLKTMKKPVPKVDYDILNKPENGNKGLESSLQTGELDQTPHIANINKRVRVSNYKRDVDKVNKTTILRTESEKAIKSLNKVIIEQSETLHKKASASKSKKGKSITSKPNTVLYPMESSREVKTTEMPKVNPNVGIEKVESKSSKLENKSKKVKLESSDEDMCEKQPLYPRKPNRQVQTSKTNNKNYYDSQTKTQCSRSSNQEEVNISRTENVKTEDEDLNCTHESLTRRSRNRSRSESQSPEPKRRSKSYHSPKYSGSSKVENKYDKYNMKTLCKSDNIKTEGEVLNVTKKSLARTSRNTSRSESRSPEPNRRSKSYHLPKYSNSHKIEDKCTKKNFCKSENIESEDEDFNCTKKSLARRSRSESRSPEPKRRSRSYYLPKYSDSSKIKSKYDTGNYTKNNLCKIEHVENKGEDLNSSKKKLTRRSRDLSRSESRSPEPNRRSKSYHLQSPDSSRIEQKYNRNSINSKYESNNLNRLGHRSRHRTPPRSRRDDYRRRERSRSVENRFSHLKSRDRSRQTRRSRDETPWNDQRKRSRSSSPEIYVKKTRKLEIEDEIQNLPEMKRLKQSTKRELPADYTDELETLRKDLELETLRKELKLAHQQLQQQKETESPSQSHNNQSIDSNINANAMIGKEIVPKKSIFDPDNSPILEKSSNTKPIESDAVVSTNTSVNATPLPIQPVKVLRKRNRTLGDSKVESASFSRKS